MIEQVERTMGHFRTAFVGLFTGAILMIIIALPAAASTFTVLNLNDSGNGSLRAAIVAANANPGGNVIDFAPGLSGTIALTSGPLNIAGTLTIAGPGASVLAVSGNDASRVFQVVSGISVEIDALTITHGRAENGGGIFNAGALTVSNSVLSDNQALGAPGGPAQGGGIYNGAGATLFVTDSTLMGDVARGGAADAAGNAGFGRGGAIWNGGDATVSASTLSANLAVGSDGRDGGGVAGAGGNGLGGGVFIASGSVALTGSTITGNIAPTGCSRCNSTRTQCAQGHRVRKGIA